MENTEKDNIRRAMQAYTDRIIDLEALPTLVVSVSMSRSPAGGYAYQIFRPSAFPTALLILHLKKLVERLERPGELIIDAEMIVLEPQ